MKSSLRYLVLLALVVLGGCQQKMARSPAYRGYEPNSFFADDRSARQPVPGTVARGYLQDDAHLYTGRRNTAQGMTSATALVGSARQPLPAMLLAVAAVDPAMNYYETFPMPMTEKVLQRGRERYDIYCAVCHDRLGTGKGTIVLRGFTAPPSLITGQSRGLMYQGIDVSLRDAPVGYYFEVITRGFGAMPDYGAQIDAQDRWAIAGYIRALQYSQHASLSDVPEAERKKLEEKPKP